MCIDLDQARARLQLAQRLRQPDSATIKGQRFGVGVLLLTPRDRGGWRSLRLCQRPQPGQGTQQAQRGDSNSLPGCLPQQAVAQYLHVFPFQQRSNPDAAFPRKVHETRTHSGRNP